MTAVRVEIARNLLSKKRMLLFHSVFAVRAEDVFILTMDDAFHIPTLEFLDSVRLDQNDTIASSDTALPAKKRRNAKLKDKQAKKKTRRQKQSQDSAANENALSDEELIEQEIDETKLELKLFMRRQK